MKKFIRFFWCCLVALLLVSCFREVDLGFPETVELSKEGEELVLEGDFWYALIYHFINHKQQPSESGRNEMGKYDDTGIEYYRRDWLKVEFKKGEGWLKLIAEPNTSGTTRELVVSVYSGYEYAWIRVIQN